MPKNIFTLSQHDFPYDYRFPGQATDEQILFIVRENSVMLWLRRAAVIVIGLVFILVGWWLGSLLGMLSPAITGTIRMLAAAGGLLFAAAGWWWVSDLWKKSICVITTKRLTKFIYTTPVNRHNLSLPLDMIVDTGSYTKGFIQAMLKLGTFTARSAAASSGVATDDSDRINKKYFYIENIAIAEDLQHYVSKLLSAVKNHPDHIQTFRPFIPNMKGDTRKRFMEQYPEYWS